MQYDIISGTVTMGVNRADAPWQTSEVKFITERNEIKQLNVGGNYAKLNEYTPRSKPLQAVRSNIWVSGKHCDI